MSKSDSSAAKKERNKAIRWVATIFFITIFVSGMISFASNEIMEDSSMLVAFIILFAIVLTVTCINLLVSKKRVHY